MACESRRRTASLQGGRGRREVPNRSARFEVSVPATAAVTQPYFLEQPRQGDSYRWPQGSPKGDAVRTLAAARARPRLSIGGVESRRLARRSSIDSRIRFAASCGGPVSVVPKVTVGLDTSLLIVPAGRRRTRAAGRRASDRADLQSRSAGRCGSVYLLAGRCHRRKRRSR